LAGQALERSDNPATMRRKSTTPLGLVFQIRPRIGKGAGSSGNFYGLFKVFCRLFGGVISSSGPYAGSSDRFVGSAEMLTFASARARSALDSIIHQLNLYHND